MTDAETAVSAAAPVTKRPNRLLLAGAAVIAVLATGSYIGAQIIQDNAARSAAETAHANATAALTNYTQQLTLLNEHYAATTQFLAAYDLIITDAAGGFPADTLETTASLAENLRGLLSEIGDTEQGEPAEPDAATSDAAKPDSTKPTPVEPEYRAADLPEVSAKASRSELDALTVTLNDATETISDATDALSDHAEALKVAETALTEEGLDALLTTAPDSAETYLAARPDADATSKQKLKAALARIADFPETRDTAAWIEGSTAALAADTKFLESHGTNLTEDAPNFLRLAQIREYANSLADVEASQAAASEARRIAAERETAQKPGGSRQPGGGGTGGGTPGNGTGDSGEPTRTRIPESEARAIATNLMNGYSGTSVVASCKSAGYAGGGQWSWGTISPNGGIGGPGTSPNGPVSLTFEPYSATHWKYTVWKCVVP